jgi:hypothetical protein
MILTTDHNPHLAAALLPPAPQVAGKGVIEVPGNVPNVIWQTRAAPPTAYENALGDALEAAFEAGAETAEQVVAALNAAGQNDAQGAAFTVVSFEAEMARLGA